MSKPNLYAFFCAENHVQEAELITIDIDQMQRTIYEVYYHIGKHAYKDYPDDNPIFSGDKYYFGGNPDGFNDCLIDYLDLRRKDVTMRINIFSQGEDVSDKELYLLLYILASAMANYEYDSRLQVYVSKEIMVVYLRELHRFSHLDTKPEDYAIY